MKKIIGAIAILGMLAPFMASAATFPNVSFSNGDVTISGTGGSTVNATFRLTVSSNEAVECIATDVIGDNLPAEYHLVGGTSGLQESTVPFDESFPIKLPPNTGTYSLQVTAYGTYGGVYTGCTGSSTGTATFNNALRVIDNGGSTSVGSAPSGIPADIWAKFMAWVTSSNSTPTPSAKCAELATKSAGLSQGSDTRTPFGGGAVGVLQGYLLGENEHITLLETNKAPYGYWGVQTQGAVDHFKMVHSCN